MSSQFVPAKEGYTGQSGGGSGPGQTAVSRQGALQTISFDMTGEGHPPKFITNRFGQVEAGCLKMRRAGFDMITPGVVTLYAPFVMRLGLLT